MDWLWFGGFSNDVFFLKLNAMFDSRKVLSKEQNKC